MASSFPTANNTASSVSNIVSVPPRNELSQPNVFHPLHMNATTRIPQHEGPTQDVFRDTLLRYAGYANEFTEAGVASGNNLAKKLNPLGWTTVMTYGIADALNKSLNKHRSVLEDSGDAMEAKAEAIATLGENVVFHSLATWFGPVYTVIQPVGKLTEKFMKNKLGRAPGFWPSVAGLATIPFIPKLFDPITERLMELTYQPMADKAVQSYLSLAKKG